MPPPQAVVKVGGSLYDLPDLATRLRDWLAAEWDSGSGVLLVPGGGAAADVVRDLDRRHRLGEETSHWLALRAMSLTAHFLASLLSSVVVEDTEDCARVWSQGPVPVLDPHAFARADEDRPGRLPHSWAVSSDAVAARVAVMTGARQLVLLKSVTVPAGADWSEAARMGMVDETFAEVLRDAPAGLRVSAVNLRTWPG